MFFNYSSSFSSWIFQGLIYSWIHGTDPVDGLQVTKYLERFNKEIKANPRLLQELVEKYFLVRIKRIFSNEEEQFFSL